MTVLIARYGKVQLDRPAAVVESAPPFAMVQNDVVGTVPICVIVQVRDPKSDQFFADIQHATLPCSSDAHQMLEFKAVNAWPGALATSLAQQQPATKKRRKRHVEPEPEYEETIEVADEPDRVLLNTKAALKSIYEHNPEHEPGLSVAH